MTPAKYNKVMLGVGLAGTLFSGYLSSVTLFSKSCAFGETCPLFLGLPSCYFGFAMFFWMFVAALIAVVKKSTGMASARTILTVSIMGTLFAGYYTVAELLAFFGGTTPEYALILPTCSYGLVFYVLMLVLSALQFRKKRKAPHSFDADYSSVKNDRNQIGLNKKSDY